MHLGECLKQLTQELSSYSSTPHLDAELLIMHCTHYSKSHLLAYPEQKLSAAELEKINALTKERQQGKPIAYILGHKEFWSLDFIVSPDVLIPRPETEHLVEWILQYLPAAAAIKVADLGVGSGAIAITLAHERPQWQIHATENSAAALKIAQLNAQKYSLNNLQFFFGNWCDPLPIRDYNVIVSNPPYIAADDPHLLHLQYEPSSALNGGKDGLQALSKIIVQAFAYLAEDGFLILEHGYNQREDVMALMHTAGYKNINDHTDLAGLPRFITGQK